MKNDFLFYLAGRETVLKHFADQTCNDLIVLEDDATANQESGLHGERILRFGFCDLASDGDEALWFAFEAVSLCNGIVVSCLPDLLKLRTVEAKDLFDANAEPSRPVLLLPNKYPALRITRAFASGSPLIVRDFVDDDLGLWQDLAEHVGYTSSVVGSESCFVTDLLSLATAHEGVYLLLKLFSLELNWVSLYRILETLKVLMKEDGFSSPISDADEEAFTNSANNFSITGLRSRHGLKRNKKLNKTPKASLAEGFELIRSATEKYLRFKVAQATGANAI